MGSISQDNSVDTPRQDTIIHDRWGVLKVTLIYAVVSALWITISDFVVEAFAPSISVFRELESLKGWLFVIVTAGLLYWLLTQFVATIGKWRSALEKSEARLLHTFDSVGTAVAITDAAGILTYVNPAYCELLDYEPHELIGRHVDITGLGGPGPAYAPRGTIEYVLEHRTTWRGEALRVDSHGRVIPVHLTVSPLMRGSEVLGLLGELVDLRTLRDWAPGLGGFALSLSRMTSKTTLDEIGEAAITEAVADTGAEVGVIALHDTAHDALMTRWSLGYETPPPSVFEHEQGVWHAVFERQAPVCVNDADETRIELPLLPGADASSAIGVPIRQEGETVGVLMVGHMTRSHAFSNTHLGMLEVIAHQLAAAMHRDHWYRAHLAIPTAPPRPARAPLAG